MMPAGRQITLSKTRLQVLDFTTQDAAVSRHDARGTCDTLMQLLCVAMDRSKLDAKIYLCQCSEV